MNKYLYIKRFIVCMIIPLFMILSIVSESYALGIAPATKIIEYDATQGNIVITSRVINNEGRDIPVKVTAGGELSDYVTLNDPLIYLSKDEPETEFSYTLDLPPNLSEGTKSLWITISEISIGQGTGGSSVGGLLTVSQQLQVEMPYKGRYAEGQLMINPATKQNTIIYSLSLTNKGTEPITSFDLNVKIKDTEHNNVYTRNLNDPRILDIRQSQRIEEQITLESPGIYTLELDARYGDKNITLSKGFTVGEYNIAIKDARVEKFRLGTIATFDISIEPGWNGPIDDVYGEMIIKDNNGTVLDKINIDKKQISSKDNIMTAHWDTQNIQSGEYLISILAYAGNQVSTKEYYAKVTENRIIVGDDVEGKAAGKDYVGAVVIALIFIAFMLIMLGLYKARHKDAKN